jgi:hypothetical protein
MRSDEWRFVRVSVVICELRIIVDTWDQMPSRTTTATLFLKVECSTCGATGNDSFLGVRSASYSALIDRLAQTRERSANFGSSRQEMRN